MKTTRSLLKKLCLIILSILLVMPAFLTVHAEELLSDYQTITIHSRFFVLTAQDYKTLDVPFNNGWFRQDAREYSHDLCKLSIGLATASFRPSAAHPDTTSVYSDMNLSHFLTEAGFAELRSDDYDKDPGRYTVSTVMGHQVIGSGDDAFDLIAVGVCGQGYIDEWESNFSIGSGHLHDGFNRSAQLVYDRIFGYINELHLEGRLKVWISGFSRAAAVSNITAAKLSDSKTFNQEDVFAYTFATPRTVIDPDYAQYTNIFNIVGKADPVPKVPFADWGYERYGQTLFLPAMETDTDFEEKRVKASEIYKQITGVDYWYNKETNAFIKNILGYLLKICPTAEIYEQRIQERLIHIWEDKSPVNVLSSLLQLANDPVLITDENRYHANQFMNYLVAVLQYYSSGERFFRKWNDDTTAAVNVVQAHTPELYFAWLYSAETGEELYNTDSEYSVILSSNAMELKLFKNGEEIESLMPPYDYDSDGKRTELIKKKDRVVPEEYDYLSYTDDKIAATIPKDDAFSLKLKGKHDVEYATFMKLDYSFGRMSPDNVSAVVAVVHKDQEIELKFGEDGSMRFESDQPMSEDDIYIIDYDETDDLDLVSITNSAMENIFWADAVMLVIAGALFVIALIFFQILYLTGRFRFRRRVKKGWVSKKAKYTAVPMLCVFAIFYLFLVMQFYQYLLPYNTDMVFMFKLLIGVLSIVIALRGFLKKKRNLSAMIVISLMCLTFADVFTTANLAVGGILHIVAYGVLSAGYIMEERLEEKQILFWLVVSLLAAIFISLIDGSFGAMRVLAIAYVASALLMIIASASMTRRVFIASILLFAAGIMLMHNQVSGETFFSHMLSLGTYYAAIALMASSCIYSQMYKLIPQVVMEEEPAK